jgi:DNA-directed RNA polymerase subunit H (RpoH/RPB5)
VEYKGAIWNKQEWETATSFTWFTRYLDLGVDRTLEKVQKKYKKNTSYIRQLAKWSTKYNWVDRSNAYDISLLEKARKIKEKKHINELVKMNQYIDQAKLEAAKLVLSMIKSNRTELFKRKKEDGVTVKTALKMSDIIRILDYGDNDNEPILNIDDPFNLAEDFYIE